MMETIHPIPAFSDNYIWAFSDQQRKNACVVDPGDAEPVVAYLEAHGLNLSHVLITHHHADHTGGVRDLARRFDLQVFGPKKSPFAGIDHKLVENDQISLLGFDFTVLEVPGHTLDHVAYFCAAPPDREQPLVFCGDTLFAAGCGRIFEGNPQMMYLSLQKLAELPSDTRVYCTHEYTLSNLDFAVAADPENPQLTQRSTTALETREQHLPTLPSSIALELATNPFLRCSVAQLARSASSRTGSELSDPVEVFAALRHWKDNF